MNEDFDYNSIDISTTSNELYGDSAPVDTKVEPETKPIESVETKTEEVEENDNPFAEESTTETKGEDEVDEDILKLEKEEKWRTKRLNKEIEAKKAAEAETARLKAELEELKSKSPKKDESTPAINDAEFMQTLLEHDPHIKSLSDKVASIKASKDSYDTMGDYADALTEAQAELKYEIKDRKREYVEYQKQTINQQETTVNKILTDFESKIDAVKESIPMIGKAKELIENRANELHVDIRRALLTAERAGELTWVIASSKKNLEYLVEASKVATKTGQSPIEALKLMGRWESEIESNKPTIPNSELKRVPTKPAGVPKSLKSRSTGNYDDMDPYEYATKVMKGEIKDILY